MDLTKINAHVKFIESKETKIVPAKDVVEFTIDELENIDHFDKKKIYTLWYADEKYPTRTRYAVQIGELFSKYIL